MEQDDNSINVNDIMLALNIEQEDFNNIKPILQTIPQMNEYHSNIHFFIILSALINILNNNISGSIIELGCCPGEITIRISRVLDLYNCNKIYNVYDSFLGFPSFSYESNINPNFHLEKSSLSCSISKYTYFLEKFNIHKMPSIHQGIFQENHCDLYPSSISLAIFDSCIYDSILSSFNIIWDKLNNGGIIIINKYDNSDYFGVKDACISFFKKIQNDLYSKYTYDILYNNYNILIINKIYKSTNNISLNNDIILNNDISSNNDIKII
jgi:hypothetical protein